MTEIAASGTAVVVVVPDLPPGTSAVVLTARDRTSNEFAYEILPALPLIHGITPNPTRIELPITIFGRYLDRPEAQVLLDGASLEIVSRAETQIVARICSQELIAVFRDRHKVAPGDKIHLLPRSNVAHLFDKDTVRRL